MTKKLLVFGKEFEIHLTENPDARREKRWYAYGNFDGHSLDAYGPNPRSAIEKLRKRAEMYLDAI